MSEIVRRKALIIRYIKLVAVAILCFGLQANASSEFESLPAPKCTPHGTYRAGKALDIITSKAKGAVVEDHKSVWLQNVSDCMNWCCRLDAGNCSVASWEVKVSGGNCHHYTCYPSEHCVFKDEETYLSYDRTLFVAQTINYTEPPSVTEIEQGVTNEPHDHKQVIKARKGVVLDVPGVSTSTTPHPSGAHIPITDDHNSTTVHSSRKGKVDISVGRVFMYALLCCTILAVGAFLSQKFLDYWERRHYTRADYLLDGMYEDKESTNWIDRMQASS